MEKFFKKEYDNFDSYEYHFVDKILKEIFGKRQMIKNDKKIFINRRRDT